MADIFHDPTRKLPEKDSQIVRVDMEEQQIGGRKSHLPNQQKNDMTVQHVPNAGTRT